MVQSILRCMDILDLASNSNAGLSMQDICKALDIKQPTAYNLVRTLMSRGYITKTASPVRYHLGEAITRLYEQQLQHQLIQSVSQIMLQRFEDIMKLFPKRISPNQDISMSFARPASNELRMMLRIRSNSPKLIETLHNFYLGSYTTSSGMAYLAFCSADERLAFRSHNLFELNPSNIWKSEEAYLQEIEAIRERGYAIIQSDSNEEFRVSAPVMNDKQRLMGVLGLGVFGIESSPESQQAMIQIMLEASQSVDTSH